MDKGTGTPPVVKGLIWFTDESRMKEGTSTVCGKKAQYFSRKVSYSFSG
jgi:hypothetical protein